MLMAVACVGQTIRGTVTTSEFAREMLTNTTAAAARMKLGVASNVYDGSSFNNSTFSNATILGSVTITGLVATISGTNVLAGTLNTNALDQASLDEIAKRVQTNGTAAVAINTATNTVSLSIGGQAGFLRKGITIGTNGANPGESPIISFDPYPGSHAFDQTANFVANGQAGIFFNTNGQQVGLFDCNYGHGGSFGGIELGVVSYGDIHLKPGELGGEADTTVQFGGNSRDYKVRLNHDVMNNSGLFCFLTDGAGQYSSPGFMATTNVDGYTSDFNLYNPVPTFTPGVGRVGGIKHIIVRTNYIGIPGYAAIYLGGGAAVFDSPDILIQPASHAIVFNPSGPSDEIFILRRAGGTPSFTANTAANKLSLQGTTLEITTNALSTWPIVPTEGGASCVVNSNGSIFILSSLPKTLTWARTNFICHPF